ncbi:MAG: hypothetical protein ACM3N9_05180 [Syntrophothermus sp.]
MKRVILFLIAMIFFVPAFSQVDSTRFHNSTSSGFSTVTSNKVHTTLRLGSQFSSFHGQGSAFSSWVAPDFSCSLTKKFSISAGFGYINTQLSGFSPYFYGENKVTGNISTGLIYMSGQYLLNKNITISGSAYKYFDLSGKNARYPWLNNTAQGVNMTVDYKVTDGFHIQAGFGYHQNNSPYYYPGTTVFGDDPFGHSLNPFSGF